jgi:hypothetical protein
LVLSYEWKISGSKADGILKAVGLAFLRTMRPLRILGKCFPRDRKTAETEVSKFKITLTLDAFSIFTSYSTGMQIKNVVLSLGMDSFSQILPR